LPVVLAAGVVWLFIAWGLADYLLSSQLQNLIVVEEAGLERQSAIIAEAVGQHLLQLHGAAQVIASDAEVIKTLLLHDLKKKLG
jgi:hypothetical protein